MDKIKKGFTLLEILIVLSIMGIVATSVYTFFFNNYKILNNTSIELDLQSEGQKVIDFIINKSMEASAIVEVYVNNDNINNKITSLTVDNVTRLVLKRSDGKFRVFQVEGEGEEKKLYYIDDAEASQEVAKNIDFIDISSDTSLQDTNTINITLNLKLKNVPKVIESQVNLRNK